MGDKTCMYIKSKEVLTINEGLSLLQVLRYQKGKNNDMQES